jgi:hypothetical protein
MYYSKKTNYILKNIEVIHNYDPEIENFTLEIFLSFYSSKSEEVDFSVHLFYVREKNTFTFSYEEYEDWYDELESFDLFEFHLFRDEIVEYHLDFLHEFELSCLYEKIQSNDFEFELSHFHSNDAWQEPTFLWCYLKEKNNATDDLLLIGITTKGFITQFHFIHDEFYENSFRSSIALSNYRFYLMEHEELKRYFYQF